MSIRPNNPGLNSVSEGHDRPTQAGPTAGIQQSVLTSGYKSGITNTTASGTHSMVVSTQPKIAQNVGLEDRRATAVKAQDITGGRHRPFMISVASTLFLSHVPFFVLYVIYLSKKTHTNSFLHSFFQNPPEALAAYAITCCVLLPLTVVVPSIFPIAGRNGFQYPLFFLYFVCITYLTFYVFHHQSFAYNQGIPDKVLLCLITGVFYGSMTNILTAVLSVRTVPRFLAAGITACLVFMSLILFGYVSQITLDHYWTWVLYIAFGALVAFYISLDLEYMVRCRGHWYFTSDWFLGFVHMHTDVFFRLPRDILSRIKNQPKESQAVEIVEELEVTEAEFEDERR